MTSPPNFPISLPRWIRFCQLHKSNRDGSSNSDGGDENPISNSVECYSCTQVGVPAFHSTSCDRAHQPEWEASAGSSLAPIQARKKTPMSSSSRYPFGPFGRVLDPRSKHVQKWNSALLLARGMALAIDPLFFYPLSIGRDGSLCLYMDSSLATIITVLRTSMDAVHLFHLWLQFRLVYVSRESLVVGSGKLVWDIRAIAAHYAHSLRGFWFDAFIILPVPQTTAMKAKERDASEEKWICYSEVVKTKESVEEESIFGGGGDDDDDEDRAWCSQRKMKKLLALKLDYQEIMDAWSGKGPLFGWRENVIESRGDFEGSEGKEERRV